MIKPIVPDTAWAAPIVLDGAMGTELERRGVDVGLPLWSANALLAAPEVVRHIHLDYAGAGAQVLTANTFRVNVRTLARAGLGGRARELAFQAVQLARLGQAGSPPWVAGSIAPVEDCYSPWLAPPDEELRAEHAELARNLADAGCDLILVETMNTIREAAIACRAAVETGLPVWVSFTLDPRNNLLGGESLGDAVRAVLVIQPRAVLINCIPVAQAASALIELRWALGGAQAAWGVYANAGHVEETGWSMAHGVTPDQYRRAGRDWLNLGATIIGGCCGTTPAHIGELSAALANPAAQG